MVAPIPYAAFHSLAKGDTVDTRIATFGLDDWDGADSHNFWIKTSTRIKDVGAMCEYKSVSSLHCCYIQLLLCKWIRETECGDVAAIDAKGSYSGLNKSLLQLIDTNRLTWLKTSRQDQNTLDHVMNQSILRNVLKSRKLLKHKWYKKNFHTNHTHCKKNIHNTETWGDILAVSAAAEPFASTIKNKNTWIPISYQKLTQLFVLSWNVFIATERPLICM